MIHLGFRLAAAAAAGGAASPGFVLEISLTLGGKVTAVLGPSGSGKTSLLEVIAGLRKEAMGRVVVDQTTFLDSGERRYLPPERRSIGYVPQEPALFPHINVRDNVRYGLRASSADRHLDETVALLEIGPLLSRFPRTLSGGEAQRVALARALVTRPRLLLLDEPLAALDAELKSRILPYLMRVRDDAKIPMLYVTHHAGEALALADEAVVLRAGRVEAKGPARDILTPRLLSAVHRDATFENIIDGIVIENDPDAGTAVLVPSGPVSGPTSRADAGPSNSPTGELTLTVPGRMDLRAGQRATFRVASEDILLLRGKLEGISARNVLSCQVLDVETFGADAIVRVETSGIEWRVRVTPAAVRDLDIEVGRTLWIAIKTHTFERMG